MVPTSKKRLIKPEIRRFETPEELLAFYREKFSDADMQTLMKLRNSSSDP